MRQNLLLCLLSTLLIFSTTSRIFGEIHFPVAERGILDLKNWNWESQKSIDLKGEWEFYWQKFRHPESFLNTPPAPATDNSEKFTQVPSPWNGISQNKTILDGNGFATYRLQVDLPEASKHLRLALKLKEIRTAYKIFVNGKLLAQNGILGESDKTSRPKYRVRLVGFEAPQDKLDIVVRFLIFITNKEVFFKQSHLHLRAI